MNLEQAEDLLNKHLIQGADDQWDGSDLHVLINIGIHRWMTRVESLVPDSSISDLRADLVATERMVKVPPQLVSIRVLQVQWETGGDWNELEPIDFNHVKGQQREGHYAELGEYIYLGQTPEDSVDGGVKLWGPAVLSVSEGGETLPTKLMFHHAIVLEAKIVALGEDSVSAQTAYAELEKTYYPLITTAYRKSTAINPAVRPDVVKRYGSFRNAGSRRSRTQSNI